MAYNYSAITINNPIASGTTNYDVLDKEKQSKGLIYGADCISKDLNSFYNNISNAIKYNQEHGNLWIQGKEYMKNSIVSIYIKVGANYIKQLYRSLIDNNTIQPVVANNYVITSSGFSYFENIRLINDQYWLNISNSDVINVQQDFNHYIDGVNTRDTDDTDILTYQILNLSTFTNKVVNSTFSIDIIRNINDKEYLYSGDIHVIGFNDNIEINISNSIYGANHYIDETNNTLYYAPSKYNSVAFNGCFLSYDKTVKSIMLNILPVSNEESSYFILSYNNTKIKPTNIKYTRSYSFYNNLSNKICLLKNTITNIGDLVYKHYALDNFNMFINGYINLDIEKTFDSFIYQKLYNSFNNKNNLNDIVNKYMVDRDNENKYLTSEILPYELNIEHYNNNEITNTNLNALFFYAFGGPSRPYASIRGSDINTDDNGNYVYTKSGLIERRESRQTRQYAYNLNLQLNTNNTNTTWSDVNRPNSIFTKLYIIGF